MNKNKAGASLDSLMSSFNARITQLQELVIARNSENYSINSIHFISILQLYIFLFIEAFVLTRICSVPCERRRGSVSGGRGGERDGASGEGYQGPPARRGTSHSQNQGTLVTCTLSVCF